VENSYGGNGLGRQRLVTMSRGRARYTQSEIERIFKAAKKVGVVARIEMEFRDGTRMAVEGKPQDPIEEGKAALSADDELERWRRKKDAR
jgi:hypothetical protein